MNEILKSIFDSLSGKTIYESPFTSTEIEIKTARLHDFFKTAHAREMDDEFVDVYGLGQQKAFEAGFYAAIRLMMK